MVDKSQVPEGLLVDTGMSLYKFKRTSEFQSFIIQFLVGLKAQTSEMDKMRTVFQGLDTDQNGFLDEKEIIAGLDQVKLDLKRRLGAEPQWDNLLKTIDKNGDGRVSYNEFTAAAYDRARLLNDKNLEIAFEILDENKDGKISKTELSKFIAGSTLDNLSMHEIEMPEEVWLRLIQDCDADGDGQIEFAEFHHYLTSHME